MKIHIKENRPPFKRFLVQWTPTILLLDSAGREHFRFEGYLPAASFLAQLDFGLGRAAFHGKRWDEATGFFNAAAARDPQTELVPEAGYWAAVAQYQKTRDATALKEWGKRVRAEFPATTWAKRAAVYASEV